VASSERAYLLVWGASEDVVLAGQYNVTIPQSAKVDLSTS
jgi:hypothetical protein